MSKHNENEILNRLNELAQIQPDSVAAQRAVQKVRDILMKEQGEYVTSGGKNREAVFVLAVAKFAVAAMIFVGFGFLAGRLSVGQQIDQAQLQAALENSLQASLESAIREDVLEQVNAQFDTSRQQTEQQFNQLVGLIEEARRRDRMQVETALSQLRQQNNKFSTGLVALAVQTEEILREKQNN